MNLRLKTKILASGRAQIAIAKDIGVAEPILSKIVNGWIDPKDQLKQRIANALSCQVEDIFPDMEEATKLKDL